MGARGGGGGGGEGGASARQVPSPTQSSPAPPAPPPLLPPAPAPHDVAQAVSLLAPPQAIARPRVPCSPRAAPLSDAARRLFGRRTKCASRGRASSEAPRLAPTPPPPLPRAAATAAAAAAAPQTHSRRRERAGEARGRGGGRAGGRGRGAGEEAEFAAPDEDALRCTHLLLTGGLTLFKHGRRGFPHKRLVWVDARHAELLLCWGEPRAGITNPRAEAVALTCVAGILVGLTSAIFKRSGKASRAALYLSLELEDLREGCDSTLGLSRQSHPSSVTGSRRSSAVCCLMTLA